jgi:serine phosphatase RsbU (regulator of sigma subunit)
MSSQAEQEYESAWQEEVREITHKAAATSWPLTAFCCFFFIFVEIHHRHDPAYFRNFLFLDFSAGIIVLLMHLLRNVIRFPSAVVTYGSSVLVTVVATIAAVMTKSENVFTYFWIVSMITVVRGLLYCQPVKTVAIMSLLTHLVIIPATVLMRPEPYFSLPNILSTNIIQFFMVIFALSGANIRFNLTRSNFINNHRIRSASLIIEGKNRDITDSISYARRIQHALLASSNLLNQHLPQHFIFFQPKDIVSGDFYWAAPLEDGSFALAVADSTGHGVPGAIMSMLNISCLNEAVTSKALVTPDEIFNYVRARIMDHMANDGSAEGGKDGMDGVLACFDMKSKRLTFAAANNPLWLVRGGELYEYVPDKMPVGKPMGAIHPFTAQQVSLKSGDLVIMITDGFADQFGGPKGKKFMYKALKELVLGISEMPVQQVATRLKQAFEQWKGSYEQVDDVLVFGVRV